MANPALLKIYLHAAARLSLVNEQRSALCPTAAIAMTGETTASDVSRSGWRQSGDAQKLLLQRDLPTYVHFTIPMASFDPAGVNLA